MNEEQYLKERVEGQINWYGTKSTSNKRWYLFFQIIVILSSSSIPVINLFSDNYTAKIMVSVLGASIAVITGIISLVRHKDLWVEYRTVEESLKHEKYLFLTKTNPYDHEEPFKILVNRVESLISQENTEWRQLVSEQEDILTNKNP